MAAPTKYEPSFSFSGFQGTNPTRPLPGPRHDVEYNNIADALGGTIDALNDIRRDDGSLVNGIVDWDSLAPGLTPLPDAPADGIVYGRRNFSWFPIGDEPAHDDAWNLVNIRDVGPGESDWATTAANARAASPSAAIELIRGYESGYKQNVIDNFYDPTPFPDPKLIYNDALGVHYQFGTQASPTTIAEPVLWVEKVLSTNRATVPAQWDQGAAYFASQKKSGDAFAATSTSYALYTGGTGDHVAQHNRARIAASGAGVRGYAEWNLLAISNGFEPGAAHALELNASNGSGVALAYRDAAKSYQILRVILNDDPAGGANNVFSTGISMGSSPAALEGVHIGMHFERDHVRSYVDALETADGEVMRIDAPYTTNFSYGGLRFAKGLPADAGSFRYVLRTDEAPLSNNKAVGLFGDGQALYWGDHTTGLVTEKPRISGTADRIAVGNNSTETNAVSEVFRVQHLTTGTPAAGIGAKIGFSVEATANAPTIGAYVGARATTITAGAENYDFVVEQMNAGTRYESFVIDSTGRPTWTHTTNNDPTLTVNGQMSLSKSSDTRVRVTMRGSDAQSRYISLPLSSTGYGVLDTLYMSMTDGATAPATVAGRAFIYVDTADGDLKVKFGDGVIKTIVVDV